ncbi:hydrogen gas-evolving membrane-bound hydrogenase subunit E [Stutzerimonas tarimensis]|uniref:Hydrogen gas-evolving membrane-bound hydrogenase subunit E n=1 Tax=Stutzerimonas tarimensis TaxID=1507735 RepID=A0ABV7T4Q2_9GAMM
MLIALLVSFLGAALTRSVAQRAFPYGGWVMAALPAGLFLYFLYLSFGLRDTQVVSETLEWVPALGISLTLTLDGFSLLFALLITGIGTLVTLFAGAYFSHSPPREGANFLTLILLFMTAMLGTVLSDNLIAMFVFWEATSMLSFMLIGFNSARPEARKAALQSLVVTGGGGLALFAGILLIGIELGTYSYSEIALRSDELLASPVAVPAMVLILLGAFTKSAQFPFHFWLPAAMEAPAPASAFLHSATMVKLGVYLLARFDLVFAGMPAFSTTLVTVGCITMLVAAVRALASDGFKEVLAHSTVGSLGVLVMLIGLDGDYSITALIAFILAHAFYKAALFFCAGTTIHAAEESSLNRLGGLAKALPVTAVAAGMAAISMAGLPPTLGFITKEYLFESQLNASYGWVVIAVAVVVNAVFAAIAGVVAIRPYWSGPERSHVHHPETPGLYIGPLILGAFGVIFGLFPSVLVDGLIQPASSVLVGHPVDLSFSLWHGFTPMLALSATVVAFAAGLLTYWRHIRRSLSTNQSVERVLGAGGFNWLFYGTLALAERCTAYLQNGDQHRYTKIVVASVILIVGYGIYASGTTPAFAPASGRFDAASAIVLVLICAGAFAATRTPSLLRAMIAVGVVGFGSALLFLMNGAPDLALTQFSVEVLIVLILVALLLRVPERMPSTRMPREKKWDILLSAGIGVIIFLGLAATVTEPLDLRLTEFFAATSYLEAHGRNVVNVVLVDYRAIDTLGEVVVVAFAAIAVWGLLRVWKKGGES